MKELRDRKDLTIHDGPGGCQVLLEPEAFSGTTATCSFRPTMNVSADAKHSVVPSLMGYPFRGIPSTFKRLEVNQQEESRRPSRERLPPAHFAPPPHFNWHLPPSLTEELSPFSYI